MNLGELLGLVSAAGALISIYLVKNYLPSYISAKGKNLADKEDIARITHEIEGVKQHYAVLIEQIRSTQQLRMAAVERRLQAHQEAFALWRHLVSANHTIDIGQAVVDCQAWWENNCLFLEPAAREAFSEAYTCAHAHSALVNGGEASAQHARENWTRIMRAGQVLVEAVQLPGLTSVEQSELLAKSPIGLTR